MKAVHIRNILQIVEIKDSLESDDINDENTDHNHSVYYFHLLLRLILQHSVRQNSIAIEENHSKGH